MYKKTIKKGDRNYSYYYTNIREGQKVKNIFLSSDKKEAVRLENELKNNKSGKENLLYNSSQHRERFGGANAIFLFLGVLFITGIFFYFFNGITGFTVLDNDIELDINKYVSLNSTVFLTVDLDEYSRPVSDFGFEIVNNSYYVDYLSVNLDDFGVNLDKGIYNVFLSLIDNGELIAIKSQEIVIEDEELEPVVTIIYENEINDTI